MSVVQSSSVTSAAQSSALSDRAQWVATICGCIVAFAYSANYTNHAPLAPVLMHQFGFNQALAGFLTTGIFATHAATQVPGGHIVDRFGAKRVLLVALGIVAIGNLGMASAEAYWQLLFFKIFTGIGTGVCFVGGARYIHAAAAGRRLNVAQGLFGGSIQLGAGFVILAVPQAQPGRGVEGNVSGIRRDGCGGGADLVWRGAGRRFSPSPTGPIAQDAAGSSTLAAGDFADGHL